MMTSRMEFYKGKVELWTKELNIYYHYIGSVSVGISLTKAGIYIVVYCYLFGYQISKEDPSIYHLLEVLTLVCRP